MADLPQRAVQFPVPWNERRKPPGMMYTGEALARMMASVPVVKMHWRKGRFTVTYADGHTFTRLADCDLDG